MEKKNYRKPDMHVVMMKYRNLLTTPSKGEGGSSARSHRMDDDE